MYLVGVLYNFCTVHHSLCYLNAEPTSDKWFFTRRDGEQLNRTGLAGGRGVGVQANFAARTAQKTAWTQEKGGVAITTFACGYTALFSYSKKVLYLVDINCSTSNYYQPLTAVHLLASSNLFLSGGSPFPPLFLVITVFFYYRRTNWEAKKQVSFFISG
jgi:hypothetical protein